MAAGLRYASTIYSLNHHTFNNQDQSLGQFVFNYYFSSAYYSLGEHTLKVPAALFKTNRDRLAERLRKSAKAPSNAVVVLQGGAEATRYCSDVGPVFRQVLHFAGQIYSMIIVS